MNFAKIDCYLEKQPQLLAHIIDSNYLKWTIDLKLRAKSMEKKKKKNLGEKKEKAFEPLDYAKSLRHKKSKTLTTTVYREIKVEILLNFKNC